VAWALVPGEAVPGVLDEILQRHRRTFPGHHHGQRDLAELRVGHGDDRYLPDRGMVDEYALDLGRVHVRAARADDLLDPVYDVEIAVRTQPRPESPVLNQPSRNTPAGSRFQ
jgi:hypothetical protein